jgi:hypothetical protein
VEYELFTGFEAIVLVTFLDPSKIDPTKLRELIYRLETIAGIQQGFEELNAGLTRPIEIVLVSLIARI